jgi:hypothetical protein
MNNYHCENLRTEKVEVDENISCFGKMRIIYNIFVG